MKKVFIAILLTLLFLPVGIKAEEDDRKGGGKPPTTTSTQAAPPQPAQPYVAPNTTPKQEEVKSCPEQKTIEKIVEVIVIKEVVVLPKGMTPIFSMAELKNLKKGSRIWKDSDGKLYLLK